MVKKIWKDIRYYRTFLRLKIWNCGIKMAYMNLCSSLDIDQEAMSLMRISEQRRYLDNIYRRREIEKNQKRKKFFLMRFFKNKKNLFFYTKNHIKCKF
ncbi:MAG: hypothetical protein PHR47_02300 [Candidatus Pacebacteria bacterium]|nr:hypothetical protein [Candidatus Paceibacterota bacterium]